MSDYTLCTYLHERVAVGAVHAVRVELVQREEVVARALLPEKCEAAAPGLQRAPQGAPSRAKGVLSDTCLLANHIGGAVGGEA